jgi:hypothetical protein
VLSLPRAMVQHRAGGMARFGEILRSLAAPSSQSDSRRSP